MDTSLERYSQKRNFNSTSEPAGKKAARKKSGALSFVIQKHAASHLHYDFRLELDGTLKSWAVPKGPSLDPKDKRLAMAVEDHPIEYASFEGTIPAGNYGAGTVVVWDRGEWIPLGNPAADYARGEIKFELRGEKLSGRWVLVKTHGRYDKKKNAWLLIKERDDKARPAAEFNIVEAMPDSVLKGSRTKKSASKKSAIKSAQVASSPRAGKAESAKEKASEKKSPARARKLSLPKGAVEAPFPLILAPQLAMLVDTVPSSGDWRYELKFDGYRILARIDNGEVRLFTRNGNDWTSKLKHIAAALQKLKIDNAWLDGEVVMMGKDNQPDFQLLQNAFENSRTSRIQYFIFDIPYYNGFDLRLARLDARRDILEKVLEKVMDPLHFSNSFDMSGRQLLKNACELKLEGLIGKRASAPYQSSRTRDWIKLKCLQRQEFVIGGYTDSKRPVSGTFGSLLLGVHEKDGRLRYAGKVGTGFNGDSLRQLMTKMKPLRRDTMPFDIFTGERGVGKVHWIEPKLVGEVAFAEWTTDGHIRHSSFQGLRTDKPARAITAELPVATPDEKEDRSRKKKSGIENPKEKISKKEEYQSDKKEKEKSGKERTTKRNRREEAAIAITHGDRVIDPTTGFTKQLLVEFYQTIAPQLLAHLRDRPVSLVRAPAGIEGQLFFQKHLDRLNFAEVKTIDSDYFPGHPPLITIDNEVALLSCTQMNVIEFHTWNSLLDDNAHPDRIVFDLDPGEGILWPQIQEAAQLMKAMLDQLTLTSFLKTSGGKGLHVVVPLQRRYDWATAKAFAAAIVSHLAATLPTLFVAKSGPKNRLGRIFIDYLRNGLGATTASAWSVRARPGLGVSIPVAWDELGDLTGGNHWTIANAIERLDRAYKNVWSDYSKSAQTLEAAMRMLDFDADSERSKSPSRQRKRSSK